MSNNISHEDIKKYLDKAAEWKSSTNIDISGLTSWGSCGHAGFDLDGWRMIDTKKQEDSRSNYKKDVSHLKTIDVYRVLELFNVTDPCLQHAAKKILCAGNRDGKSQEQDIREAIDTLNRKLQMIAEDCNK